MLPSIPEETKNNIKTEQSINNLNLNNVKGNPTRSPAANNVGSDREIVEQDLFNPAVSSFKRILFDEDKPKDGVPMFTIPDFNTWYKSLDIFVKGKNELDKERLYKLKQAGNLLTPQPTGGFIIKDAMNDTRMKSQYMEAIENTKPVIMVITEPFVNPVEGSLYIYFKQPSSILGLLYNKMFETQYKLPETIEHPDIDSSEVNDKGNSIYLRVSVFEIQDKARKNKIKIANWHGNSSGSKAQHFIKLYEWCLKNRVHYITGDSNITVSKTKTKTETGVSIGDVVKLKYSNKKKDYSKHYVKKDRYANDILLNNQIEKAYLKPEIDGMFILECTKRDNKAPIVSIVEGTETDPLIAFETLYSPERPILADHSVVQLDIGPIIIKAASGAEMDDETKGIFPKNIWQTISIDKFHENYGQPYTEAWIKVYNDFINKHSEYTDYKNPILELKKVPSKGGRNRTRGKPRKKNSRKRKTRKTRTWSSSR